MYAFNKFAPLQMTLNEQHSRKEVLQCISRLVSVPSIFPLIIDIFSITAHLFSTVVSSQESLRKVINYFLELIKI